MSDWGERHLGTGTGTDADSEADVVYRHGGCGGRVTARLTCECGARIARRERLVAQVNR